MSDNFREATKALGAAYREWKGGESRKEIARNEFFRLIEEEAAAKPEEKLIEIDPAHLPEGNAEDGDPVAEYVEREHPAWNLDEYRVREEDDWVEAILVLKPELKARTYVNPDDGMVYQRQFVNGSPVLDDELLREVAPDLWIAITDVPNYDAIAELLYEANVPNDKIEERIKTRWQGPRTLKSLDSLDEETQAAVAPFVHPGKPSVKLAPPRKAKPEELEQLVEGES